MFFNHNMNIKNPTEIDLFFIRLKHGWISNEKKKLLYDLVISLDNATKLQKKDLYYFII